MADFYKSTTARRVRVYIAQDSKHWNASWETPHQVVAAVFKILTKQHLVPKNAQNDASTVRLMDVSRGATWRTLTFDVFHKSYDAATARQPDQGDLPVISIGLDNNESLCWAGQVGDLYCRMINARIRTRHVEAGIGSEPPFYNDHTEA